MATELTISKANSFVEASYQMTLDEMRVLSLTLGVFDPTNPKMGFDLTVSDFCKTFPEVNPDIAYTQVQNAIRKISKRWMTLVDNEKEFTEVSFVTKKTYFKQEGRFYIEFHKELMPYISNLKQRYTTYQLVNIGAFNSTHTIRLYELMAQYKNLGCREISIDGLKDWLQIVNKYPRYNSLNEWVITPAVKEINEKSDLNVSYEPIKRGRKIIALKFTIKTKKFLCKKELKRPPFPHKNKYGKYVHLDKQNPAMSNAEYGNYAYDCLKILDEYYNKIDDVTPEDLRNYWVFLAVNASHKTHIGTKQNMLDELRKRRFKLVNCELIKLDENQIDLVDKLKE